MKHILLGALLSGVLFGCASKIEKEVIIEHSYITYDIPKTLREPCVAKKPISEEAFTKLTPLGREAYLTTYAIDLMTNIKECDSKVKRIGVLIDKQNKLLVPVNKTIGVKDGEAVK